MNEERTVHSSGEEDVRLVRPHHGSSRAMLLSYLAMCLLCGVCLWIRFYGVSDVSPISESVCIQDVYADFDFPYVSPQGDARIYRAGDRLARAGESMDAEGLALVSGYWSYVKSRHEVQRGWQNCVQMMLIMCGMMLCFLFCLHLLRPSFFRHTSNLILCLMLACLHFGLVTGCYVWMRRQGMYSSMHLLSLLPLCLVPGLATHLLGTRVSICLTLLLTSLTALLMEGEFQFVLFQYTLICSLVGIAVYRPVRRYRQLLIGGVIIVLSVVLLDFMAMWHRNISWPWAELASFGSMIMELSFWRTWEWGSISSELHLSAYWSQLFWFALVNGVFTTLMMLVLPKVFEKFFDVISPISLQGLSNLEHPLLERLRKEARGTYEHCMAVGQMAGDAAEAIGADKVLAKTCGFFHDIGKLSDPRCFAENAYAAESPHRFLSPYESSNRIRAHVKQGGELARKYHLQRPLLEAIRCHHGNDLVVYFYRKAVREAEASNLPMPDEKDFRYEAALPHRSEAVIVEIADICEAASRAELAKLDLVDRKTVKAFVDKLVMGKMEHGQFADADMTLAEFTKVCDSMVDSLCSRYHQRPKYNDEELRPLGPPSGLGMEIASLTADAVPVAPAPPETSAPPAPVAPVSPETPVAPTAAPVAPVAPTAAPVAPVAPTAAPVAPVSPETPVAPPAQVAPVRPETPVAPTAAPVAPVAPVAPTAAPVAPVAPTAAPVAPVAPTAAPVAPVAPTAAPVAPVAPAAAPVAPVAPTAAPVAPVAPTAAPVALATPESSAPATVLSSSVPSGQSSSEVVSASSAVENTVSAELVSDESSSSEPVLPAGLRSEMPREHVNSGSERS